MGRKYGALIMLTAVITIVCQCSFAESIENFPVVFQSGNWQVRRSIDPMKDTVNCTGIFKGKNGVQLNTDSLLVSIKGGIQGVTLRFDDKPARSFRQAEKMEKDVSVVIMEGLDFKEAIESNRLRVEALTLVRGVQNEDLDLSGIKAALENINGGCPVQPTITATVGTASEKPLESACTNVLVSRMKAQGIKEKQILAICKDKH